MVERRLDDPHQRSAKRETNNHRYPKRESHLHDGPAEVFQMLEKRLRRFSLRRITKFKDVSQRHRVSFVQTSRDFSLTREREKAASGEGGANAKRIGIANFILRNHLANLFAGESSAIKDRFAFLPVRPICTWLDWTRQKEITSLVGKPWRGKKVA